MAINWIDGFEMYNANLAGLGIGTRWSISGASISNTGSRTGAQCASFVISASNMSRPVPASDTQGFAMAKFISIVTSATALFEFREGSLVHGSIRQNLDGSVSLYRGNNLIQTSDPYAVNFDAYNFFEFENFVCSDTVGGISIKINKVLKLSVVNSDTRNGGAGVIDNILIYGAGRVDDCYSTDGPTYGDNGMYPIYADSDSSVQWTPNSGTNNYSRVNELIPNGDTSYVQASTIGELDQYGFQDLPSSITNVNAVNVIAYARKTDTGSRAFASRLQMGGNNFETGDYGLSDTYSRFETLMVNAPDGAEWNRTKFNSVTAGPKVK